MHDYYRFRDHPVAAELERRISRIYRRLAATNFSGAGLYRAQKNLLSELLLVEDRIKTFRNERTGLILKANRIAISVKQAGRPLSEEEKAQTVELQAEAEYLGNAIQLLRFGRWLLRYVADGIAWRAYGYRRYMIRALGAKEPIAFLSDKQGLDVELETFRSIRKLGRDWLPLLHDLTNCIRTADLSVFWGGNLYRLIEVKSRRKQDFALSDQGAATRRGRASRQQQRLERIMKFFESGNLADLQPGMIGKSIRGNVPEIHNFAAISEALSDARTEGYGIVEPERGLLYLSWDLAGSSESVVTSAAIKRFPYIFDTLFTFRSISPRFEAYHWSLPITAMELPPDDVLDLLFESLALIVVANYSELEKACQQHGISLHIERGEAGTQFVVTTETYTGQVREGLWDRVTMEALSLRSFCMIIKSIQEHVTDMGLAAP